jgi:lysophospholipase
VKQAGAAQFDRRAIPPEAVETRWQAADGWPIRRIDWLIPRGPVRGSLLFVPGRGDFYEKYLETLDYWHRSGWRVTAIDLRGQAGSGRLGNDPLTGHIDDFETWVADLAGFWTKWRASTPGPHVLVGHSMGGHLVLRAIAEGKLDPDAAALSAPMLGFTASLLPAGAMHWAAKLIMRLGDPRRPAWKWSEKPGELPETRARLLTHDPERYADELWWREHRPELAMGPGSWGWVERGYASMRWLARVEVLAGVKTPVLLLCADNDKLVSPKPTHAAARHLVRGQLVRYGSEARHELLREADAVRDKVLATIDDFLDRAAPRLD